MSLKLQPPLKLKRFSMKLPENGVNQIVSRYTLAKEQASRKGPQSAEVTIFQMYMKMF